MEKRPAHRPVDQAKQRAILASARAEFFRVGFAAASIERMARTANVSKVTVYNHYQTKERLFAAMVAAECGEMSGALPDAAAPLPALRPVLVDLANAMMRFLSSPDIIRFDRRMAAEVERHPAMGHRFLEAGPHLMRQNIANLMANAMARGQLASADPASAAAHFYGMIKGFADVEWRFSDAEQAAATVTPAALEETVDRFLIAYAP